MVVYLVIRTRYALQAALYPVEDRGIYVLQSLELNTKGQNR